MGDGRVGLYAGFCPRGPHGTPMGGHPSRPAVAGRLERSTRRLGRAALERLRRTPDRSAVPLDLAPGGVYRATPVTRCAVVSYTAVSPLPAANRWRSVLCGTVPRVTPGRCWRPPCPVEPGRSSAAGSPPPTRPPSRLVRRFGSLPAAHPQ